MASTSKRAKQIARIAEACFLAKHTSKPPDQKVAHQLRRWDRLEYFTQWAEGLDPGQFKIALAIADYRTGYSKGGRPPLGPDALQLLRDFVAVSEAAAAKGEHLDDTAVCKQLLTVKPYKNRYQRKIGQGQLTAEALRKRLDRARQAVIGTAEN